MYDRPLPIEDEEIMELTKKFADTNLFFAVFWIGRPEMIGYVNFHRDDDIYHLGYCFKSEYQRKGYAFESCRALMNEMERIYTIKSFMAGTALKNAPSCRLLEKLGFERIGEERVSFNKDADGNDLVFDGGIFVKNCDSDR